MTEKTMPFYGYWILAVSLISLFMSNAAGFYSFGVFFKPVQADFNWDREVTSVAFLMLFLVQSAASPFVGRLTDRYGSKKIMILGAFIMCSGLFLTSLANGLPLFYTAYAINGLGESFLSMISVGSLISKWFVRRRGMAVGVATTGIGLAGVIAPPLIGIVLIPAFGWRAAYQIVALLSVVFVAIPAQLLIKPSPEAMGLYPDGAEISETADEIKDSSCSSEGWKTNAALKTSTFWFIAGVYFLFQFVVSGATQHLINHLTDFGFLVETATMAVSFVGLGSAIGKFSFGVACDFIPPKYNAVISFSLGIVSFILATILPNPAIPIVFLSSFFLGLCIGGWAPVTTIMICSNFGLTNYGSIYGILTMFMYVGVGVGPTFFGYVYDTTSSYYLAYIFSLIVLVVATIFILTSRHTPAKSRATRAHCYREI